MKPTEASLGAEQPGRNGWAPEYSVVVPVFNSGSSVELLVERLSEVFERDLKASFEIILVDDGSRAAGTWPMLSSLAEANPCVSAVQLMKNYGKPSAVICGLARTQGRWVVTIDDDLQQRPEDIAELAKFREHDIVVATYEDKHHRADVRLASSIKTLFDKHVLGLRFPMTPLKLIKREVVDAMLQIRSSNPYIPALLSHASDDFFPVPLQHQPSQVGKSRYNYVRRIRQFSNLLISNSGFLLRTTAVLGFVVVIIGFCLGLYSIALGGGGDDGRGWNMLIAFNVLLNGLVLLGLGFVGEYLVRIVNLSSVKPAYVVRREVSGAQKRGLDPAVKADG